MDINKENSLIKVVVLGGYGNFGKRIVEHLSQIKGIHILIAGRNFIKAQTLAEQLKLHAVAQLEPIALDINKNDFTTSLIALAPYLVIHTGGPFQEQSYLVPQACIDAKSHYIDLADDRRFVCDINQLNDAAKMNDVLVISGASSVPGLSSAIVEHYLPHFSELHCIDIAIAPGNKAERGEATVRAILSYTGHPFKVFRQGQWQDAFGWMDSRKQNFGDIIGKRWLANVDVPDLELFPQHYQVTNKVRFQAGLELSFLHLTMVGMAFLAKNGIIKNWQSLTKPIVKASNFFMFLGSDQGAMQVTMTGLNKNHQLEKIKWTLYAPNGIGPYIPTLSTIIIAKKLITAKQNPIQKISKETGAMPCMGHICLEDFFPYFDTLSIYHKEDRQLIPAMKGQSIG